MLERNRLLINDRRGRFLDVTTSEIGDLGRAMGVAPGDIDNDGDLDIFQPSGDPQAGNGETNRSFLLLNLGEGRFLDVTEIRRGFSC